MRQRVEKHRTNYPQKISQRYVYLGILVFFILNSCATLPANVDRPFSSALKDTGDTTIGTALKQKIVDHPGKSGFLLLGDGLDAFVARAVLADVAERSIDVQYYLYHNDLVGTLLSYNLLQETDRGVRVRVLLDDMGLEGRSAVLKRPAKTRDTGADSD